MNMVKRLKEKIKLELYDANWKDELNSIRYNRCKKILLIGSPIHGNLGDHAIAECIKKFIKKYFIDYCLYEITMPLYLVKKEYISKYIEPNDIICISGGGWMGDLWVHNEEVIRDVVNRFLKNQIVIFPQTVYYTNTDNGTIVCNKTVEVFSHHHNILFCVRDKNSYELVRNKFILDGKSSLYFCPDMVMYNNFNDKYKNREKNNDILICIRKDCESVFNGNIEKIKLYIPNNYTVKEVTTVKPYHITIQGRQAELESVWTEIANSKLMITDRLHAMLFSYINNTQCMAFDNKTGKVWGQTEFLNKKMVSCIKDFTSFQEKLELALNCEESASTINLYSYYETLYHRIKERIKE